MSFRSLHIRMPRPRLTIERHKSPRCDAVAVDWTTYRFMGVTVTVYTTRPGHDGKALPAPKFKFMGY